jgi:dipeptidase D
MSVFNGLKPEMVWKYFEEICKIPRLSKSEENIRKYLREFSKKNDLESYEDKIGNILIIKPSDPDMANRKTVVLQSHMDMVGEKNADYPHDWSKDPIIPYVNDGWVGARGTTLGADDGIGIASQLAILTDKTLKAGKIECLFTVDEESGMTGAINLEPDFFSGRILLNLDSEDEGILFIGCAGGMDTVGTMEFVPEAPGKGMTGLNISITGLRGGHSGDEIHKGFGNSVKIMNRLLWNLGNKFIISVGSFNGGNLRNAIPREAFANIAVERSSLIDVKKWIDSFYKTMLDELGDIEKGLKIIYYETEAPNTIMDKLSQAKLLSSLTCCPHGAIAWSKDMEDLVETSTNLASVNFTENNKVKIVTTQRSSIESSKHDVAAMVETCLRLAGADVEQSDGYPGWKPNMKSDILKITRDSYLKLFAKEPHIRAIHAGLECGLIYKKFEGIDMISFGPTIRGAHTPDEKIEIRTAQMFWDLLLDVISNIPLKQ